MQRDTTALTAQKFDLLVIGAGIHGACVARDAALRGLRVALIDKGDLGGATSHNSLKTIHGGIRYLQHFNFKRTIESIKEQRYWLKTAPHLVKPLTFMMPTYGWGMRGPIAMYIGIRLFELLSFKSNRVLAESSKLARGKVLSKQACLALAPDIPTEGLSGGAQWDEAQVEFADQAVMQLVQHAVDHDAVAANYVSAESFLTNNGTVIGVEATDQISGENLQIRAKLVVNAAGPWVAELLQKSDLQAVAKTRLPLSKSMNVVTRLPASSMAIGVQSRLQSDSKIGDTKRLYFMVPWQGCTMIGTTHFAYQGRVDSMTQRLQEIADFVKEINHAYPSLNLSADDVLYCYQGLGPADDDTTSKATQLHHSKVIDHEAEDNTKGLISVISVKWTTARLIAEKVVNLALRKLTPEPSAIIPNCATREKPVPNTAALHGDFCNLNNDELIKLCELHMQQTMATRLSDMLLRRSNDLVTNRLSFAQLKLIANAMSKHYSWTGEDQRRELKSLQQFWLASDIRQQLEQQSIWSET